MARILVVEDDAVAREPFRAILGAHGFDVVTASNGQEALRLLETQVPDLVLLDLGLPVMDGPTLLRYMRQDAVLKNVPVIVISGCAERHRVIDVMRYGVSGYLLKSHLITRNLLDKVSAQLHQPPPLASGATESFGRSAPLPARSAASSDTGSPTAVPTTVSPDGLEVKLDIADWREDKAPWTPIADRAGVIERLKPSEALEGFSPAVCQILDMTSSDTASMDGIARVINQDPAIAVKVLRLANSPQYCRGGRVQTIQAAAMRLGVTALRDIALSVGVVERFSSHAFTDYLSTSQFWEHSIACGLIARELSLSQNPKDADCAFTCGLLHDLGRVILSGALGEQYTDVLIASEKTCVPLEVAENRLLRITHASVMDRVLKAWNFPAHLVEPIVSHHAILSAGSLDEVRASPLAVRLAIADALSHAMLLGHSGNEVIYPVEGRCRQLGITGTMIRAIEANVRTATDEARCALLSTGRNEPWSSRCDYVRSLLKAPFRPRFTSTDSDIDISRLFCCAIADCEVGTEPNVHILRVNDGSTVGRHCDAVLASETRNECLPLLVLSSVPVPTLPSSVAYGRAVAALAIPFTVMKFVSTLNSLLAHNGSSRTAA